MIDNKPLVSIGMPVYNGEKYLRQALDSLLAQDYENFELIISDNASTDATWQICREYAAGDARIRLSRNERNLGALANFGIVLNMARGPYFMWVAADDYWLPEFVSVMANELEAYPEAGVAMCAVDRVLEDGTLFDTIRFCGKDDPNQKTYYQMVMGLASPRKYNLYIYGLFRTMLLRRAMPLFPEIIGNDRWFMFQIALATRFRYVDRVLHTRTVHNQPFHVRLPDERTSKMLNEDKWVDFKVMLALGRMLCRSSVIPWYRKAYIPAIMFRYVRWVLLPRRLWGPFWRLIRPYCPPGVRRQLRRGKEMLASR